MEQKVQNTMFTYIKINRDDYKNQEKNDFYKIKK